MLTFFFKPAESLISISPQYYARLYEYLKNNIHVGVENTMYDIDDAGYVVLFLTPETIKKHEEDNQRYRQERQLRQKQ